MTPKLIGFIRRAASIGIRGQRMVSRKPLIISGRRLREIRITRWRTRVWRRCASVSRLELTDVRRGENSTRSDDIVDSRVFQVKIARGPQELLKHMRADLTTYHKAVPARSAEVMPGYGLALVMVKPSWSVPKKRASISAQAAHRTAWSDRYSGWLGVSRYEFHVGSAAVCGLPS